MAGNARLKNALLGFSAASGAVITLYVGFSLGSVILSPSEKDLKKGDKWNRIDVYDRLASTFEAKVTSSEKWLGVNNYRKNLLSNASGRVLEVACGTGINFEFYPNLSYDSLNPARDQEGLASSSSPLMQRGNPKLKLVLIDQSKEMIGQCLIKAEKMKEKLELSSIEIEEMKVVDAHDLSVFADESFDTVVDTFGICSFDNPQKVLSEMRRVLKPDGKLLLLEHGRSSGNGLIYKLTNYYLDKRAPLHECDWGCSWNRDIVNICERNFEIIQIKKHFFQTIYEIVCKKKKQDES